MFQFSGFARLAYLIQQAVTEYYFGWVFPFGDPRVKACLPLTEAYRSYATSFIAYHCQGIHLLP
jgi:hypothetical protein